MQLGVCEGESKHAYLTHLGIPTMLHAFKRSEKKNTHIFPLTYLFTASTQSIHSPCLICWEFFLANNLLGIYNAISRSQGFTIKSKMARFHQINSWLVVPSMKIIYPPLLKFNLA